MFHRLYEQSDETIVIVCTYQSVIVPEFQYISLHSTKCTQRGYVFHRLDDSADKYRAQTSFVYRHSFDQLTQFSILKVK